MALDVFTEVDQGRRIVYANMLEWQAFADR